MVCGWWCVGGENEHEAERDQQRVADGIGDDFARPHHAPQVGQQTSSLPGTARRPARFRRGAVKSKFLAGSCSQSV